MELGSAVLYREEPSKGIVNKQHYNQSTLKEINSEYSLEELMLKLKLQYSGHMIRRTDSLEQTLMLGNIEGGRKREQQRMSGWMASLTQWT